MRCRLSRALPGRRGSPADRRSRSLLCEERPQEWRVRGWRRWQRRGASRPNARAGAPTRSTMSPAANARLVAHRRGRRCDWQTQSLRCRFSSIFHDRMHELGHIAAQHGDFPYQGRGDEGVLLLRGHEYRFDFGSEVPAHISQLKLEFEVRYRAQAAHDHGEPVLPREVDGEADVALHLDIVDVRQHAARHIDPLLRARTSVPCSDWRRWRPPSDRRCSPRGVPNHGGHW